MPDTCGPRTRAPPRARGV